MANKSTGVLVEKAIENEASGDNEQCEDVEGEIYEQPTTSKKSKKRKAKKRKKAKQAESPQGDQELGSEKNNHRGESAQANPQSSEQERKIVLGLRAKGYSEAQITALRLKSPKQAEWSRLNQKGELSDLTWNELRTKVEEAIKNPQNRKQFESTWVELTMRCTFLSHLYKHYVEWRGLHKADYVPLAFVDLCCQVPAVAALLMAEYFSPEIIVGCWDTFEERLPALWIRHSRRVEIDCISIFLSQMRDASEAGLPFGDALQTAKAMSPDNVDPSILQRAYVWFEHYEDLNLLLTFDEIIGIRRDFLYEIGDRFSWRPSRISISRETVLISKALLRSLEFPEDTEMRHIQDLDYVFACPQCEPSMRKPMTWYMLVYHLRKEIMLYREAQQHSSGPSNPAQAKEHKLEGKIAMMDSSYTGPSPKKLVKTWANQGISATLVCEFCFPVSERPEFKSKGEKDAHMRHRHKATL